MECAHQGAEIFLSIAEQKNSVGPKLNESEGTKLLNILAEFIFFMLYTTDYRLCATIEKDQRFNIMDVLLRSCIDSLINEHIPHWSEPKRGEVAQNLLETYSKRAELYAECDRLMAEGDDSISSNYMYVFGEIAAKLSNNEGNLELILVASALAGDLSTGAEPFEGLRLESFAKSLQ